MLGRFEPLIQDDALHGRRTGNLARPAARFIRSGEFLLWVLTRHGERNTNANPRADARPARGASKAPKEINAQRRQTEPVPTFEPLAFAANGHSCAQPRSRHHSKRNQQHNRP